jgi:hypothetical protein
MSEFNIGDHVIIQNPGGPYDGKRGMVVEHDKDYPGCCRVRLTGWDNMYCFGVPEAYLVLEVLDTLASLI